MKQSGADQIFEQYKENLTKEVEEIFAVKLLENHVKLDKLRKEMDFPSKQNLDFLDLEINNNNSKDISGDFKTLNLDKCCISSTNKFSQPSNHEILQAFAKIQPHVQEMMVCTRILMCWLELQKCKFETGNTFGSEVIDQLTSIVSDCQSGLGLKDYLLERRKLMCKLDKHPNSEDTFRLFQIHDYQYWLLLEYLTGMFYRGYAQIYDILKKNWDTVMETGSSDKRNCDTMY